MNDIKQAKKLTLRIVSPEQAMEMCSSPEFEPLGNDEREYFERLMCFSQELLNVLERIIAITDREHEAWIEARALIAKIKGDV